MRSREEEKRVQRNERNGGKEGRGEERKMKRGYQLPKKKKKEGEKRTKMAGTRS